jgi:uncharacterized FAD-dependent dehydrogenase
MPPSIVDLNLDLDTPLEAALRQRFANLSSFRILKKSIDARKSKPQFVYRIEIYREGQKPLDHRLHLESLSQNKKVPPVLIVGTGPAGLFAALRLAERGIASWIFERGSTTTKRLVGISQYWRYGKLHKDNNVCFGEGGAGLYSDGKLITRIKSDHIPYVLDRLVQFGAPEEIRYLANPHVGSDKIRKLIPPMREFLISKGCQFYFDTEVTGLLTRENQCEGIVTKNGEKFLSPHVILATGHSATNIYDELARHGVKLEGKSFALGFRVEHPQKVINRIQFKDYADHPALGAANYKLTHHDSAEEVGVYSFCMCPGGYVIASSTDEDGIVSNGMSNYARNSPFANSAIVVSVDYQKYFGDSTFDGLQFIRKIEQTAKAKVVTAGGSKELPAQRLADFLKRKKSDNVESGSCPSKSVSIELSQLLPTEMFEKIAESFEFFHSRRMRGFIHHEAQIFGVETRTSAPIRIPRDPESFESVSHRGLYPAGEGAGYAGGITSAAVDGVRVAEAIYQIYA